MEDRKINPLIYADIDLNIIDGSSIWVTSILETLAQDQNIFPTVLLKRPINREVLIKPLYKYDNITIINPWSMDFTSTKSRLNDISWEKTKRLTVDQAAEIMDVLDEINHYDMFLVRGYSLSQEISKNYAFSKRTWFYLTDFPQREEELSEEHLNNLKIIFNNSAVLACQTETLIDYFKKILNSDDNGKFVLLPPMVPNQTGEKPNFINENRRLIYAGKFAPYWKIPEMFEAFAEISDIELEFIVVGDKFHNFPYTEDYQRRVERLLTSTKGIVWKRALTRQQVQHEISQSDLGISWRHEELDDSKELSTKVLEFGLHGKPVIINRNPLHENVFGEDYPLYANSEREFIEKVKLVFTEPSIFREAAEKVYDVSQNHMFSNISKYLRPIINNVVANTESFKKPTQRKIKKIHLLFAGHDLKFAKMLIDYFSNNEKFYVKLDQWSGHNIHDEEQSKLLLKWADVIVAEWGLGNAVWYSKNLQKKQKLIVRMHLQEKNTPFPKKIVWNNVDQLIFIAPGLKQEMIEHFNFLPIEKTKIIYNLVNTKLLDKEKLPESKFNIGLMGISPSRKRLDLALDIFEKLWKKDNRYNLLIKGHLPNEYKWLWNRVDERKYYEKEFRRINNQPWGNSVVFEGWGDVSEWYQKINFVLSPSDFESFHLAVAEGMASKTIPVIRNWYGADMLYPDKYIFSSVDNAVEIIERIQNLSDTERDIEMKSVQEHIYNNYDKYIICQQWENMILELIEE